MRGEIYFVKFIINPDEDDIKPGVIFRRSFLRLTKAITDFGTGTVMIYPELDPFLDDSEEEEKGSVKDLDDLFDFDFDDIPLLLGEEPQQFVCKIGKSGRNKKKVMEKLDYFYQNIRPSSSTGRHMTQEEAEKEALVISISQRIYEELGRDDIKKVNRGIIMVNYTKAEALGVLLNVLCQVGFTTLAAKFLVLDIPIDRDTPIVVGRGFLKTLIEGTIDIRNRVFSIFDGACHQTFRAAKTEVLRIAESDSDDKEEYVIKRNNFGTPIYNQKPTTYRKGNNQDEGSLTLQAVINPFNKISMWKKAVSFLGSLPVPLKHINWKPNYKGSYTKEEEATGQWHTEIRLTDPYGNIYIQGFTTKKTDRKLSRLREHTMMRPDHQDPNALDNMKPWKSFYINEPVYAELCHEFYSTYEFDEICADNELRTKKIIKFRLGGRAHNLTLLEFACRLGLYHAGELEEDGFDVYFQGGLHSDDNFNAQEYWLSISREENLGLSRSHTSTIRSPVLRVIHKMITYGLCQMMTGYANVAWLIAKWMKRKGAGTQRESQICCGQFISKLARKSRVLTDGVIRRLSAPIYCRDLDTTTLRELIDFEGRLIPEDPQPSVPRVGIPRPPRASMQDLYDRMGRMEIRQEAI
ncbi:hypothetical protein Tco_0493931 [Tanacetum coccineum]